MRSVSIQKRTANAKSCSKSDVRPSSAYYRYLAASASGHLFGSVGCICDCKKNYVEKKKLAAGCGECDRFPVNSGDFVSEYVTLSVVVRPTVDESQIPMECYDR